MTAHHSPTNPATPAGEREYIIKESQLKNMTDNGTVGHSPYRQEIADTVRSRPLPAQPVDASATRDIIGTKVSPLFVVDVGDIAQIRSALVNAGYSEEYIRKTLECITSSPCNKTDLATAARKQVIEEILLWRIENRGKKLGYCTNGMIEDQFLTELMGLDCWTPEEYNAKITTAAKAEVLDELKARLDNDPYYGGGRWKYQKVISDLRSTPTTPSTKDGERK